MYHSPGLRDGVLSPGTCVQRCLPKNPGSDNSKARIFLAGNKFVRAGVLSLACVAFHSHLGGIPGNSSALLKRSFDFLCVCSFGS